MLTIKWLSIQRVAKSILNSKGRYLTHYISEEGFTVVNGLILYLHGQLDKLLQMFYSVVALNPTKIHSLMSTSNYHLTIIIELLLLIKTKQIKMCLLYVRMLDFSGTHLSFSHPQIL